MSTDVVSTGTTTVSTPTGTNFIVLPGAALGVASSGSVVDAVIVGGTEYVYGADTGATVTNGGTQLVLDGGTATDATIATGSYQGVFDATVVDTLLAGYQQILTGATSTNTTITSGGEEYVGADGTANGTIITSGGAQYVDVGGVANTTEIDANGTQAVFGTANTTAVNTGALELIAGTASNSIVSGGGTATVQFGGTAVDMTVQLGGYAYAIDGTFDNTTVNGYVQVLSGGVSNDAVINSGGSEYIGNQGSDNGSVVNTGGLQYADSGATITNATIDGGFEIVAAGASASGTTVNSGEQGVIGSSSNTTLAGGQEVVFAGGTQDNVTFTGAPANLNLDSASGLTGTVSGFAVGDTIDFVNQTFSSYNFDGATLSVVEDGTTYNYQFAGVQSGTTLNVGNDGNGGTSVTLALIQASASLTSGSTTGTPPSQDLTTPPTTLASSH